MAALRCTQAAAGESTGFFAWRDFARVTGERFGQCGRFGFDATDEDAAVNFGLHLSCPSFRIGTSGAKLAQ